MGVMLPSSAIISFISMALSSVLAVFVLTVVRIPKSDAVVFYLMTFDKLFTLSLCVMLIATIESLTNALVTLIAFFISHVSKAENDVPANSTAVKKDAEDDDPKHRVMWVANMEVLSSMNELLKLEIEKIVAAKTLRAKVESFAGSDACVGSSSSEAAESTHTNVVAASESDDKRAGGDVSDENSSSRSAALTACV
jgi:hypothetical protein